MKANLAAHLSDSEETLRAAKLLGELVQPGDTIGLIGDLGAGKTTFVQGLAAGMGIRTRVTSPTFTLVHEYPGAVPLFHFDPYRLESLAETLDLGLDEYLQRGGALAVEWAGSVAELLPEDRLTVEIAIVDGDEERREMAVSWQGSRSCELAGAWLKRLNRETE
jgi:tRNA threonylcarbamoyladenosine biosynthesis protein TsaE